MKRISLIALLSLSCAIVIGITHLPTQITQKALSANAAESYIAQTAPQTTPTQQSFIAANNLKITIKEVAPYNQDTDLQTLCFFKHKSTGDTVLSAVADLDKKLGGIISTLRNSGQFVGEERETLVFTPPQNIIKPRTMMLMGLGDEKNLSIDTMSRIGTAALREAVKLKATRVSYASALRDQGNATLDTGDVAATVVHNVILAYDTEKRLQAQALAQPFTVTEWVMEAGADYYASTVTKVQQEVARANAEVAARPKIAFVKK